MTEQPPLNLSALLNEAMSKSGLLWIDVAEDRTWPAWHVWDETTAFVVSGPGEQPLPWLPKEVNLILRSKDTGGRILTTLAYEMKRRNARRGRWSTCRCPVWMGSN